MALTAGLNIAQRLGYLKWLPMNAFTEKKHGNYTLMLGLANAFVASTTFTHVGLLSPQPPQKQADHGEG